MLIRIKESEITHFIDNIHFLPIKINGYDQVKIYFDENHVQTKVDVGYMQHGEFIAKYELCNNSPKIRYDFDILFDPELTKVIK